MTEGEKEQVKLLATALNTLAINTTIVGFVVPIAAAIYKLPSAPSAENIVPAFAIWPGLGYVLHLCAKQTIKGIDP